MDLVSWPALPLADWKPTYATLHRWAQIVGKVKLALTPRVNHFWSVAFEVTPRGLTTGEMPWGDGALSIDFDLLDHQLRVSTSWRQTRTLALEPRPVADFYRDLMAALVELGIAVQIDDRPVEIEEERIRFTDDRQHTAYDPASVERCLSILQESAAVLETFRARFLGKASPIQFYWGTFDLAASRFSGRAAPPRPGADAITREAYSHEVFSSGFWPGDRRFPEPAFYAYLAPAPAGLAEADIRPSGARWQASMGEFLLPYEAVRRAADPPAALLEFFQSAYDAAADLARWDRTSLERS
jgi:hypothetical protein